MSPTPKTPLDVACPKCQMPKGQRCRTIKTDRLTDTHEARWLEVFPNWHQTGTPDE